MTTSQQRCALLSVSDKTGLKELAHALIERGFQLLATGGTASLLQQAGLDVVKVEEYIDFPEILEGRVKTLHPRIHAGLLAKRQSSKHLEQLQELAIHPIEVAVVNLYPFREALKNSQETTFDQMIELIDIGGPTMIRAAAKNYRSVYPVVDPADYAKLIEVLDTKAIDSEEAEQFRYALAKKVFREILDYDRAISSYLEKVQSESATDHENPSLLEEIDLHLTKQSHLRYGENPHQQAAIYCNSRNLNSAWEQLHGKELSYNNMLDADACYQLLRLFQDTSFHACCIVKHLNPCGVALAENQLSALKKAKQGDPRSHFGGILGFQTLIEVDTAENIAQDFAEIVIAPDYSKAALKVLQSKKNLRILRANFTAEIAQIEMRSSSFGMLIQETDMVTELVSDGEIQTKLKLTDSQRVDLDFAWKIAANVKSNAIVIVKDQMVLGVGAGQMSRIDSVELALRKAVFHGHDLAGAVAASDAFFPFSDNISALAEAGISAIVSPGGSLKDQEVVAKADELGLRLVFMSNRHFRH